MMSSSIMCQLSTALASVYHLLADFEFTPYQAPAPHPWYWYFRWLLIGLAVRAFFWVWKQLPKKDAPPDNSGSKRKMPSRSPQSPAAVPAQPVAITAILVLKDGEELGPYTLEEINRTLSSGEFLTSDLAWHEGLAEWVPLKSIAGVAAGPAHGLRPPPPPPHAGGTSGSQRQKSGPRSKRTIERQG